MRSLPRAAVPVGMKKPSDGGQGEVPPPEGGL